MCPILGSRGRPRVWARPHWVVQVGVVLGLQELFLFLCFGEGGWRYQQGWGGVSQREAQEVVVCWCDGGCKRPERLTGDERQCHRGTPKGGRDWGTVETGLGWQPERRGHGSPWRGSQGWQ